MSAHDLILGRQEFFFISEPSCKPQFFSFLSIINNQVCTFTLGEHTWHCSGTVHGSVFRNDPEVISKSFVVPGIWTSQVMTLIATRMARAFPLALSLWLIAFFFDFGNYIWYQQLNQEWPLARKCLNLWNISSVPNNKLYLLAHLWVTKIVY